MSTMKTCCQVQVVIILTSFLLSSIESTFLKEIDVKENSRIGLKIADIKKLLVEQQKINEDQLNKILFHSVSKADNLPFTVYDSGEIKLEGPLDRERICSQVNINEKCEKDNCCKILNIQSNQYGQSGEPLGYLIKVHILDENDEKPRFSSINTPYKTIPENANVGSRYRLPLAIDLDWGKNSIDSYKISQFITGDDKTFQLVIINDDKEPYLELKQPLDREKHELYRFILQCSDGGEPANIGSINIEIKIQDVNDHYPEFDKSLYKATIPEGDLSKTLFIYNIKDEDSGENSRVSVQIQPQSPGYRSEFNPQAYFKVISLSNDGKRGQLKPSNHLDYEHLSKAGLNPITFNLIATDHGKLSLSSTAKVEITVLNVNDVKPQITFMKHGKDLHNRLDIPENIQRNSWIAEILVQDEDSKKEAIECRLKNSNDDFLLQPSESNSHALRYKRYNFRTEAIFDREKKSLYSVIIECKDGDPQNERTTTETLTVSISDINDNSPQFEKNIYIGEIREGSEIGSAIHLLNHIVCRDEDSGINSSFSYSLKADSIFPEDVNLFTVEASGPNKGEIRIRTKLDFEKKQAYQFLLVATDHGEKIKLSSSTTIKVNVLDVNDNQPQFSENHYTFSVSEGAPIGTEIGQVTASDLDSEKDNKEISYFLQGERDSLSLVRIDERSGILRTSQLLDRETKDSITLTVVAKNPAPVVNHPAVYPVEASILITVININDNKPEFRPSGIGKTYVDFYLEDIVNHQPDCKPLPYTVSDRDHDSANGECCDLSLKNNYGGLFSLLSPLNSMLCIQKKPPTSKSYQLTLVATDKNGNDSHKSEITFSVIVKSDPSRSKGPMGRDQTGVPDNRNSRQFVIVIILAVIVSIFCLILIAAILVLKKCNLLTPRGSGKDKPDIQFLGPQTPSQRGTLRTEKVLNEAHNLLSGETGKYDPSVFNSELGESDHLFNGSENNPYETRMTYQRTRSKSCDSVEKAAWRSPAGSFQMHKPQQHKSPSLVDACRFPSASIMSQNQHYQTVKQPFNHSVNKNDVSGLNNPVNDNSGSFYQAIEPYNFSHVSNYNTIIHPSSHSIYAGGDFNKDQYVASLYSKEGDNMKQSRTSESDKSEDNIYAPKKTLKSAYFQTSFV